MNPSISLSREVTLTLTLQEMSDLHKALITARSSLSNFGFYDRATKLAARLTQEVGASVLENA